MGLIHRDTGGMVVPVVVVVNVDVLVRDRVIRTAITGRAVRLLDGTPGRVWTVVGAVLGLFVRPKK